MTKALDSFRRDQKHACYNWQCLMITEIMLVVFNNSNIIYHSLIEHVLD